MRAGYHRDFADAIEEHFSQDGELAQTCAQYLVKMKSGFYSQQTMDLIFQDNFNSLDMVDAYIFSSVFTDICMGNLLCAYIPVGCTPCGDRDPQIHSMAEKISRKKLRHVTTGDSLSVDFVFWGGNSIGDGLFRWNTPLHAEKLENNSHVGFDTFDPDSAPLEMGTTRTTTTFYHLLTAGKLARWPYGSNVITVMLRNKMWSPDVDRMF